jgi:hypothetical protein
MEESKYRVVYRAGTYEGKREVFAEDGDHAIAKVRAWVRKNMMLPMYSESYRIEEEPSK